jgi:hypothetical protein
VVRPEILEQVCQPSTQRRGTGRCVEASFCVATSTCNTRVLSCDLPVVLHLQACMPTKSRTFRYKTLCWAKSAVLGRKQRDTNSLPYISSPVLHLILSLVISTLAFSRQLLRASLHLCQFTLLQGQHRLLPIYPLLASITAYVECRDIT